MWSVKPVFVVLLLLLQLSVLDLKGQDAPPRDELASGSSSSIDLALPNAPSPSDSRASGAQTIAAPSVEERPFTKWSLRLEVNSLGPGFGLSTSLGRHFDLRGGANIFGIGPDFEIDGLHYNSDVKLRSGNLRLDWFLWRRNLHVSPGILYFNNYFTANTRVPPGQHFELGDDAFTNSVNDPVHGEARLEFPRRVAPMVTMGFHNLLPGHPKHFFMPLEFGAAFTGSSKVKMDLNGTACQQDGCFTFAENPEALRSLRQEIGKINDSLSDVPIYPILSIGVGYRF